MILSGGAALVLLLSAGVPMAIESAGSPCVASEKRALRLNMAANAERRREPRAGPYSVMMNDMTAAVINEMATGYFASVSMRSAWPNVPVVLSCGITYWRSLVAPGIVDFARIANRAGPPR